jgi:hypothetical protein
LRDKVPTGEIAHQAFVDRCAFELEAVDVLGQRQLRDGQLILDRASLLLEDLRLQQVAGEALRLMLAFERRSMDLVIGVLHREEPELAHQVEDFGSLHDHVLLS